MVLNKNAGGALGGGVRKYSDEELKTLTSQYDNLKEFIDEHQRVYWVILARGSQHLLDHMHRNKREPYTFDELHALVNQYQTREALRLACPGAYMAIYRQGLSDDLFAHTAKLGKGGRPLITNEEASEMLAHYNRCGSYAVVSKAYDKNYQTVVSAIKRARAVVSGLQEGTSR